MLKRCENPKSRQFADYGGRGITVCERWHDFADFLADMGERPSEDHSIDRFPNQNGNYEPGNCRWATRIEQNRNKRSNRLITIHGETHCVAEWAELRGIAAAVIRGRLCDGWSGHDAVTVLLHERKRGPKPKIRPS